MAVFGNNVGGSIRINGQVITDSGPRCSCGNTTEWDYMKFTNDKYEAKCSRDGEIVKN